MSIKGCSVKNCCKGASLGNASNELVAITAEKHSEAIGEVDLG